MIKLRTLFLILIIIGSASFYFWSQSKDLSSLPNEFGMRVMEKNENVSDYIKSQMGICFGLRDSKCYKAVADLFVSQFSFETILDEFTVGERSKEVFSRCHEVAHYVGRRSFEIQKSVPLLFSQGSQACWGGFYHGVIEGYFDSKNLSFGGTKKLAQEIKSVCGNRQDYKAPRTFNECVHGIGHALMFISSSDLPRSLEWCDELPEVQRRTCYGGVFMENSSSSTNKDHPSKYTKSDDPLYPCNILSEKYLETCYEYQSSYFAILSKSDWAKNSELCELVPKIYQHSCFRAIGANQVGHTQELLKMHNTCQMIKDDSYKSECITGVVYGLAGRYMGNPHKMIGFCDMAKTTLKSDCWRAIGYSTRDWAAQRDRADLICASEDQKLADICRKSYLY